MKNLGWILLLGLAVAPAASGQGNPVGLRGRWAVGVSLGSRSFWGATRERVASPDEPAFAPYNTTLWGLRVGFGKQKSRVELTLRYGQPGIRIKGTPVSDEGEQGSAVIIVAENAFHLTTVMGSVSTQLRQLASGPVLRASLGIGIEHWSAPGAPARILGAGQLGLSAEVSLGGGFVAALEGELGFTPKSPFRQDELPEGYERRSTWTRSLQGAVYLRF